MNNLKFRAWDKKKDIFTNYQIVDNMLYFMDKFTGVWIRDDNQDRFALMQSTGLKDKNGKEIYEGDVLKVLDFTDWKGEVRYSQEELSYFFVEYENSLRLKYTTLLSLLDKNLEVIGNIYENKELLR